MHRKLAVPRYRHPTLPRTCRLGGLRRMKESQARFNSLIIFPCAAAPTKLGVFLERTRHFEPFKASLLESSPQSY